MNVPVGLGSIVGYGGALILAAIAGIEALEANGPTPGAVKWMLILGAAKAALTTFGRQYQAAQAPTPEGKI
jgi:hypothetical protein